jgi:hypothetical protein
MFNRERGPFAQIERDAHDERVALATTLRKCIALGAQTRNAELRDWATNELNGYRRDDEVPEYRIIHAPLMIDGTTFNTMISGEIISSSVDLPEFARDYVTERMLLAHSVDALEALVRQAHRANEGSVHLAPSGSAELIKLMNYQLRDQYRAISRLYWSVSTVRLEGVLGQIRTTLVRLVAEMRAAMGEDQTSPAPEHAAEAVHVVLNGGSRNTVTISQASVGGTATVAAPATSESPFWTRGRTIGGIVVGICTVIAALAGVAQCSAAAGAPANPGTEVGTHAPPSTP